MSDYFWSRSGRELFYQQGAQWWRVAIRGEQPDAPFALGRPVAVPLPADVMSVFAESADGQRLLARRTQERFVANLAVVDHFFEELRAKLPVK